jgi:hypothetical protein
MPDGEFTRLEEQLLAAGVVPRNVRRIVDELEDHLEDLRAEAVAIGYTDAEATAFARSRLGDQKDIAQGMLDDGGLKAWIYRYPRLARVYLPVAYLLVLPAAPVFAGLANPGKVVRWGAALMMSAGVTAAMLLGMQLAILLT